jgi:hypothetical protein
MTNRSSAGPADQGKAPWFRFLLAIQVVVGGVFGFVPFLFPGVAADAGGYTGSEPFIYRLAGAATLGYVVAAAVAIAQPAWYRFRIPAAASYTFNAAAMIAALITLFEDGGTFWVWFILIAATTFVLILIYVTRRNEGPAAPEQPRLDGPARVLLTVATIAAAFFGLAPLFAAQFFADFADFDPSDLFVYRMAGAATFGYAFGGYLSIRDGRWEAIRVQNLAAIVFNALSAVAALMYVMAGGSSLVAWVILIAATLFAIALTVLHVRKGRLAGV